ncbi:MAG: HAD hydrolase family protein [Bacteroidota bacterium]
MTHLDPARPSQSPVSLFVLDIDGCLATAFEPADLKGWSKLAEWNKRSVSDPAYPALAICSGRPKPYVEALAQALSLHQPAMFEMGAGAFFLHEGIERWHPLLTEDVLTQVASLREYLIRDIVPAVGVALDYSKRAQTGLLGPSKAAIDRAYSLVKPYTDAHHPDFDVFTTDVSIDIVYRALTKRSGMKWMSELTGISLPEIAYIGDSGGDVGALGIVGHPFAPANAIADVQAVAYTTRAPVIDGVLEAYQLGIAQNRATSSG